MSPEERQLLAGLFERTKAASSAPRDQEAETFISEQVKAQPYAPYLLAQTVIVQEQALEGANARIGELEARVRELESKPAGGFLGGLFGSQNAGVPPRAAPRPTGPWGNQGGQGGYAGGYAPPPAPPPGYYPQEPGGGGFLRGALGTAAGVAGGVLLADSIRNLFSHGGMGGMGNMANLGIGSGFVPTSETTIVNNYYGDDAGPSHDAGYQTGYDDQSDDDYSTDAGYDDDSGFGGGDGGFDV